MGDARFADGRTVDSERGLVARAIFSDPDVYREEMERIFHRCWLFLGHESMLPSAGSFITTYMGEDPVIVWRDARGQIGAFLNTCPHRGNKVCLYDVGRAASLTCSYHGWTYNSEGQLTGVPFFEEAYYGDLDRESWGLVQVPKVAVYGGLIFGCWDEAAPSLDDYLGELRWYLDNVLLHEDMGGLEALPGCQRYAMRGNWKLVCDNFTGDGYHVFTSHAATFQVTGFRDQKRSRLQYMARLEPAHGLGSILTDTVPYENDLAQAQRLGPEVVEYVEERYRRAQERLKDVQAKPYGLIFGNCFPNLNIQAFDSALRGHILAVCHPRGPDANEMWQWCLIERAAPAVIKRIAARNVTRGQSGSGLIGIDDAENFERIAEAAQSPMSQGLMYHYAMGLHVEGRWPGQDEWDVSGMPGLIGPHLWETNQRHFYAYWARLMGMEESRG